MIENKEFSLLDLLKIILQWKVITIITVVLGSAIGVLYSLSLDNKFKSTTIFYTKGLESGSGIPSSLQGLSSFAGINLAGGDNTSSSQIIAYLNSYNFFSKLSEEEEFISNTFAYKDLDSDGKILIDEKIYDVKNKKFVNEDLFKRDHLFMSFHKENLIIFKDPDGFINVSFIHQSPMFAQKTLNSILEITDNFFRQKDQQEAQDYISFLESALLDTKDIELNEKLISLMQRQYEKLMLTKNTQKYLLDVIEEPTLPDIKHSPSRAIICIIFFGISVIFALFLSVTLFFLNLVPNRFGFPKNDA